MIQFKALDAALLIGGAIGVATSVVNPMYSGVSLAFMGGLLGGASLQEQRSVKKEKSKKEAERVGGTFAALYDKNRGLIDPVELSFLANCPLDHAHAFLSVIAEESNGQKVATQQGVGVVFNFPHSKNALDDLSKNAANWAQAQNKQLQLDLDQHKRALQMIQAQQAATAMQTKAPDFDKPDPWGGVSPGL
tara:strand:- start:12026 stop:12598 length:573 start_codon:yes stop_codon:yes gene_type:complete